MPTEIHPIGAIDRVPFGIRVLHIIHNLELGGAQSHLINLATQCHDGIEGQSVFYWKRNGAFVTSLELGGIAVHGPQAKTFFSAWRGLCGVVKHWRPTVIHAHMSDSTFWAARLSRRFGLPFVVTFQDGTRIVPDMPGWKQHLRRIILKRDAKRAMTLIAVSKSLEVLIREAIQIDPAKVVMIANCVKMPPAEALASAIETRTAFVPAEPRIVAIGRYVDIKGFDQLIAAAPAVLARWPAAQIDIVGSGPQADSLRAQVAALGLQRAVHITGPTDDVSTYLRRANVYVSSSHYEGTSLATLEAMSWCTPVVASDVPGNRDLIAHEYSGLLYPLNDTHALASSIMRLLEDRALSERLTRFARTVVERQYGSAAILDRHLKLYRAAASRSPALHGISGCA